MTAEQTRKKEWLMRYRKSEKLLNALKQQLKKEQYLLKEAELYMDEADAEEVRQKISGIRQEISEQIQKVTATRERISKAVHSVPDATLQAVLTEKFLCGKTNEETAEEMYYLDVRTIQRKTRQALDMLEIPEDLKGDSYGK